MKNANFCKLTDLYKIEYRKSLFQNPASVKNADTYYIILSNKRSLIFYRSSQKHKEIFL